MLDDMMIDYYFDNLSVIIKDLDEMNLILLQLNLKWWQMVE